MDNIVGYYHKGEDYVSKILSEETGRFVLYN